MAYWVEIHCDVKRDGITAYGGPSCWSHSNNSPGVMIATKSNIPYSLGRLAEIAREAGWVELSRGRWCCPACNKPQLTIDSGMEED